METRDDVEAFAALLRQLKDRTDRSYGSLARRVNMNTSTLHRYCAGEAVPQDFAPVERLASFCEATPEERLELHRLWLLAVAARQRVRTNGSAQGPVPAADADPAGSSGPAQALDPPEPSEPAPAHRPWYRRRRVLASTAVACALLATLGSLSALSDDRGSSDTAASPSGRPGTTAAAAPHRSSKPSASPSPGSTSPSPHSQDKDEDKGRDKGKGKDSGSTAPANGTGTGQSTVGTPLTWSANSQIWQGGCGHDYVIDKAPTEVPPPPLPQDAAAWAATQGAVHGRQTMVQISVQGRSSTAVVLEALRVRIAGRADPVHGNAYSTEQGCGGGLTPRSFDVNLDIDRPIAHSVAGNDGGRTLPAVQFPYRVSAQDPEVLLVTATTETYDCNWYLELDWSSQGRTGTIRIDDHGRPFRTSGIKGLPHYGYGTNGHGVRQWVPYGS
ncbi:helix-turn-helix transcriptional regulator [Streptomyces sp. NPDC001137]|uniref:helix-turn-helix domain-containing protein n=1 Tax=Streptomyces sp. NPDC001137 TaxID=3154378 RepID=UPI0033277776